MLCYGRTTVQSKVSTNKKKICTYIIGLYVVYILEILLMCIYCLYIEDLVDMLYCLNQHSMVTVKFIMFKAHYFVKLSACKKGYSEVGIYISPS